MSDLQQISKAEFEVIKIIWKHVPMGILKAILPSMDLPDFPASSYSLAISYSLQSQNAFILVFCASSE
jgi:hypothetical protein